MDSLRLTAGTLLCVALHPSPAHAVWEYSLAAQLAMHDGLRATCGKIESRLGPMLNNEWSQIIQSNKIETINTARKTQEYENIYRLALHEYLKNSWNDPEEAAHMCEALYAQHNNNISTTAPWWRDRSCAGITMNSTEGRHCTVGPSAAVSFANTMPEKRISILRIVPSSDVSFPRAGTFVQQGDLPGRFVSNIYIQGAWAVPDSIDFEWKEWPSAFPKESSNDRDLKNLQNYADQVRVKVQRKHAKVGMRNLIPNDVIAKLLQSEQAAESEPSSEPNLKLFFVFTQDGLRFRWEQWQGECIEKYGGDNIDLPRNQLLSGASVCGKRE